jgi:hypothetical protein
MAEIVNLKRARKAKAAAEARELAAENRARSGRTKGAKQRDEAEAEALARLLDGARREPPWTE